VIGQEATWLTSSAAALRLGISKSTLLRAVRRGRLGCSYRTPGRHFRFAVEDLDRFRRESMIPQREGGR
jgi:excisionase family DNA binding protein